MYEIYTYGGREFIENIFTGIALFFNPANPYLAMMKSLVKVGLIILLFAWIWHAFSHERGEAEDEGRLASIGLIGLVKIGILSAFVLYVFLNPVTTVVVNDLSSPAGAGLPIENVSYVTAVTAHYASVVGKEITEAFSTAFTPVDSPYPFSESGATMVGIKYMDSLLGLYPPDSSSEGVSTDAHLVTHSLKEFYKRCVFPNFADLDGLGGAKSKSLNELMVSTDLMTNLKGNALYHDPSVIIVAPVAVGSATCRDAIYATDTVWNNNLNGWVQDQERKLMSRPGLTQIQSTGNLLTQTVIERYFTSIGGQPYQTVMKNLAAANVLQDAYSEYSAAAESAANLSSSLIEKTSATSWTATARFISTMIETMRSIFEGLIYAFSIFLPLAFVFGGINVVGAFAKIALWLQLWGPFYVILNAYGDIQFANAMSNVCGILPSTEPCGPAVKTISQIAETARLSLSYTGALAPLVPTFAWGLLRGGVAAVQQLGGLMAGGDVKWASAAGRTGADIMGRGNVNLGNRSIGSDSFGSSTLMASMAAGATGGYLGMQRLEAMRAESNGLGGDAIHAAGLSGYTAGSLQAGSIKAQGLLHNAAQSEGLIPPGADMSDFGTMAKTSAKLGTPGGAVGYTVGPDGQVVQSDKNASHTAEYGGMGMQDPSTHWKGHGHETVQAAMSNTMKNTAARNLNKSQTTMSQADSRLGFAEANALSSSLAAVKGLQQTGRISKDEGNRMAASYQNLESAKTGATETLKKTRGYSHEQAEAIVRGLSATGGVGFNFIVKAQGMSEVTTRNSGQMTAQDKAEEDKAFTNLKEAQKQVGHTDERTRGLLKSDSSEQSKGLRESFDAAHTKRQEAAQGYQKAATDVTTAQDTYQYAKEHGASLAMSLFPEVVDKMNSELGPEKTAKTMSEVGIGSHPQAEQTVQDYAQGVINDHLQQGTLQIKTPQDIDKGHAEQSSSVNARISEGRQSSEKRVAGQGGDNFDAVRQKAAGEYGVKGHSDFSTQQQQFWRGDRPEAPGNWRQDPRFKDSEGKTMKEQIDKAGADRFQDSANLRDNVTDRLDSVLWNTTNKASRWLAGFGDVDNVPALMKDIQPLPRDHWKGPQTPSGTNGTAVDTSRPKEPSSPTDGQRYWETDSRFGKSPSNAGDQATIPSHTPIRLR